MQQDSLTADTTLYLPTYEDATDLTAVDLSQDYWESCTSADSLYYPELDGGRYGVAGDPVPYTVRDDNVITSLLLVCFVVAMLTYSASHNFVYRQARNFFYASRSEQPVTETSNEVRLQVFFMAQTAMLVSLLYFFYVREYVTDSFIVSDEFIVVALYLAAVSAYYILRFAVYGLVNSVFFDGKLTLQWTHHLMFITSCEGVAFFPAVLMLAYFNVGMQNVVYYLLIVAVLVKLLIFYKCYVTFFRQNGLFLQIFLYFCALEIVPLFALWGGLGAITNALKVNF